MFSWISSKKDINDNELDNIFLSYSWHAHSNYVCLNQLRKRIVNLRFFIETQNDFEYYFTEAEYNYLLSFDDLANADRSKAKLETVFLVNI